MKALIATVLILATGLVQAAWTSSVNVDPMTDKQTTLVRSSASSNSPTTWGKTPNIVLRCKDSRIVAYVEWNEYFADGGTSVGLRFDKETATKQDWDASADNSALFSRNPYGLLWDMERGTLLTVSARPYNENDRWAKFDLNGFKAAIAETGDPCFDEAYTWHVKKTAEDMERDRERKAKKVAEDKEREAKRAAELAKIKSECIVEKQRIRDLIGVGQGSNSNASYVQALRDLDKCEKRR